MRTIYKTDHLVPLYIDHERGTGAAKYITHFEAEQMAEKGGAVIVDTTPTSQESEIERQAYGPVSHNQNIGYHEDGTPYEREW